ncbi:hypothetical protein GH714_019842 [Hevea brasiliensis]|uniref:Uncharacterized protein n=1 Tax=Hevea brasiliensis TaxID=3981 RepID=A0A6A6N6R8_HEVBR|nr:hypothetical protein GH714_019842 [Hevea brasiliensis]
MSDTSQKAHEDWNADVNISALASEVMKLIKRKTVEMSQSVSTQLILQDMLSDEVIAMGQARARLYYLDVNSNSGKVYATTCNKSSAVESLPCFGTLD